MALTQMRTRWGSGALQGGDLRLLEDGCERGGALSSNIAPAETANEGQSRNVAGEQGCQRALAQKQTLWSWFERRAAYLSDCSVELPLRPSASAAPPSGPSWLRSRLRGWGSEVGGELCQWALTQNLSYR